MRAESRQIDQWNQTCVVWLAASTLTWQFQSMVAAFSEDDPPEPPDPLAIHPFRDRLQAEQGNNVSAEKQRLAEQACQRLAMAAFAPGLSGQERVAAVLNEVRVKP